MGKTTLVSMNSIDILQISGLVGLILLIMSEGVNSLNLLAKCKETIEVNFR